MALPDRLEPVAEAGGDHGAARSRLALVVPDAGQIAQPLEPVTVAGGDHGPARSRLALVVPDAGQIAQPLEPVPVTVAGGGRCPADRLEPVPGRSPRPSSR